MITITFFFEEAVAAQANRDDNSVLPKAKPAASRKNSRLDREINALPDKGVFMNALVLHSLFFRIHELSNFRTLLVQLGEMLGPQSLVDF